MPHIVQDTHYVFDGESLLLRFPRIVGRTFDEICQLFTTCYGTVENRTVIFDGGYVVPSTKGSKHIKSKGSKRRLGRKIVPSLHNP